MPASRSSYALADEPDQARGELVILSANLTDSAKSLANLFSLPLDTILVDGVLQASGTPDTYLGTKDSQTYLLATGQNMDWRYLRSGEVFAKGSVAVGAVITYLGFARRRGA